MPKKVTNISTSSTQEKGTTAMIFQYLKGLQLIRCIGGVILKNLLCRGLIPHGYSIFVGEAVSGLINYILTCLFIRVKVS